MKKSRFLAVCSYVGIFTALAAGWALAADENTGEIYGVIEIGASGIKGVAVQTGSADPESPPVKVLKEYEPLDKNAFHWDAAASGRAAEAVEQMYREMEKDFNLAIGHLCVVGSSGIPDPVRKNLADSVWQKMKAKMEFISVEKEVSFEFRGIVPPRRVNQVVFIDIGSGNAKGAYSLASAGNVPLKTFVFPWGTKTWAHEINQARGDGDFQLAADLLGQNKLLPAIKQVVQENPGINSLRRVYLAGGITWAMCTLLHPYDQGSWVKIEASDIDTFFERTKTDPDSLLHPDLDQVPKNLTGKDLDAAKEKAKAAVTKVGNVFSEDQLAAGAQILKELKETFGFDKKDAVFFAGEKALYAWPLGYVLEKVAPVTASR
jgi:hypothetical protein